MSRIKLAECEVLDAARCTVNSYRAAGGYTMPLSENLRRLAKAQGELDAATYVVHRDQLSAGRDLSDNAGWDRSVLWGGATSEVSETVKAAIVVASPKPTNLSKTPHPAEVDAAAYLARRIA
jgi:hypothetical protein